MLTSELLSRVEVIGIPTRTNFRGVQLREIALIRGEKRWGEFSPFKDYSIERDALWLQAALEAVDEKFPAPMRTRVLVNATLPEVPVAQVGEVLSWFPGSQTVKVKVGTANDEERIEEVFQIIPDAQLRLDANGMFSIAQAQDFFSTLYNKYRHRIEYVEQPCATLEELRQLKEKLAFEIKIAGDEVIRKAEDPFAINLQGAVDILMLKAAPLGGITRAREIGAHHKLPMVVSSALDSAVGISYGLQLAASLPSLDYACGLATGQLLSADIAELPLKNGELAVHSVSPDADLLAKYAVPVERLTWWKERTKRAFYAGAESEIKARGWNW